MKSAPIYFDASRVRPEIRALVERPARITLAEWEALRANGHERLLLYPRLDDEALAWALEQCATEYAAPSGQRLVPTTNPDLGLRVLAPLAVKRLRECLFASQCGLTQGQLVKACANVGVDLTCGACAATFYTGAAPGLVHECKERADG